MHLALSATVTIFGTCSVENLVIVLFQEASWIYYLLSFFVIGQSTSQVCIADCIQKKLQL